MTTKAKPYYDPRNVPFHGDSESTVFLVNEAPGPCEAHYGIPAVGQQGGNIYRALRRADIGWASRFEKFSWPIKIRESYKHSCTMRLAFELRDKFLAIRANHMTCTNSYDFWPRSTCTTCNWVDPEEEVVLAPANVARLRGEVPEKHRVILVCGEFAWLACHGTRLLKPETREGSQFSLEELITINGRLFSKFTEGWYMGHTRRWTFGKPGTSEVLRKVALAARW